MLRGETKAPETQDARSKAVLAAIEKIRAVAGPNVSAAVLDEIKTIVISLAERTELFPREQFPLGPAGAPRVYYLAQDPDGRFAMYASAGAPGKSQPPHDHTTWAVISGIYGEEHNVLYERDREDRLAQIGELTVRRGNAIGLLPEHVHTIRVTGEEYSLHLHAYGRSLEQLPERVVFESTAGGAHKRFPANPNITSPRISARELKALVRSSFEFALLDVRDEVEYGKGHPFFAASAPPDGFEKKVTKLVPRHLTTIVLYDGGDGEVEVAAAALRALGYKNVSILEGGLQAWIDEGFEIFSGFNVASKAFGEAIERREGTPHVHADELQRLLEDGKPVVVLDSRPLEEFKSMSVPGAICCPGGELVYRVHDAVTDPNALVVVNCAGRTRSIIGAQSLINTGLPNRVVALANGTMGWQLAGFSLAHGVDNHAPEPSGDGLRKARAAAIRVAERFGVRTLDASGFRELACDTERTLYVFDVRTPQEYREGHLAGARSAPGGQLVQATDEYVGVHRARIVLVDNDGVRGRMTASWLAQMGDAEVCVLDDGAASRFAPERGAEPGWAPDFGSGRNKPYGSPEAMQSYLSWETGLVEAVRRDGDAPFLHLLDA